MRDALFAVLALVGMMVAFVKLRSEIGGWDALSKQYRCLAPFTGSSWRHESGRLRRYTFYRGYLIVGADPQGLFLAVPMFHRLGHPPLFIPWRDIIVTRAKTLWVREVRFEVGQELRIPLTIGEALAQKLQLAAGSSWPVESNPSA